MIEFNDKAEDFFKEDDLFSSNGVIGSLQLFKRGGCHFKEGSAPAKFVKRVLSVFIPALSVELPASNSKQEKLEELFIKVGLGELYIKIGLEELYIKVGLEELYIKIGLRG